MSCQSAPGYMSKKECEGPARGAYNLKEYRILPE
ncbi:unnamed protein product [Staurois parvus]|uniref:Ribulose-1,5-bisphosphate carboxylase/oxygenase large subunit n=1 Tax=Staurois parvus TaxID=386267 RepID=A0ABN9ACQ2_9NEOB|nr:unnamed protein product [Staurois parvus]